MMHQHGQQGRRDERETRADKRGHFRRRARAGRRITVRYLVLDGDERGLVERAHTLNIGVGGAFIATEDPPPPGSQLVLQLTVPPLGRTLDVRADVRWIADGDDDDEHGMGVRFHDLDEESQRVLADYFASLTDTVDHDEPL